jgi:hypothetical protein
VHTGMLVKTLLAIVLWRKSVEVSAVGANGVVSQGVIVHNIWVRQDESRM